MTGKILKSALLSNALFSTGTGIIFLLFGRSVTSLIGIGTPLTYQIIGLGLLGFAAYVGWVATRAPINTFEALQISVADILWVVGTIILVGVAYHSLNGAGIAAMSLVATIVLAFAVWQLKGIGDFYAVADKEETHRICVAIDTLEPANKMWEIVSDMEHIDAYSPHLAEVILRNQKEPDVGVVRQCTDNNGKTWAEQCTQFDVQARKLDVVFLADEPGFPYPFKSMIGGWEVVPTADGSTVKVHFEVSAKNYWLQPIILGLMSKNLDRNFGDVVARMAATARGEAVDREEAAPHQGISYSLVPC